MAPVSVLLPKLTLPIPLITPLKEGLIPVLAAIVFVVPALKAMALLIVLLAFNFKVPPMMVTPPVDKLEPISPPEETDKVPDIIVVPPL